MKCECGGTLKVIEVIGQNPRLPERIIAQCPICKSVTNTIYDPRDWWTEKQKQIIERLINKEGKK